MSRSSRITPATQSQEVIYSDFLTNLRAHPVSKQTLRLVNEQAVTRSIRNLLLTTPGERLFQPNIGSGIRDLLFEDISVTTSNVLKNAIRSTIDRFEPRAKIISVNVIARPDNNSYDVEIIYALINSQQPIQASVTLKRLR